MALFILTPIFLGAAPVYIYGYKNIIGKGESIKLGLSTLLVFTICIFVFAFEGLICIAMAAPIGIGLTIAGSLIAYFRHKPNSTYGTTQLLILFFLIPTTAIVEKEYNPASLIEVTTSIEIQADINTVWKNVIIFQELPEPTEFIFNTGISYPTHAEIDGYGVGAIRYCIFSTGQFVEPITVWDEPNLLAFDVIENPPPMKEISFWDINAPHLHDYFVSRKGRFKLEKLSNGNTLLIGTTWYTHDIHPEFYWKQWSQYIIHKIHTRVLEHIKTVSENSL